MYSDVEQLFICALVNWYCGTASQEQINFLDDIIFSEPKTGWYPQRSSDRHFAEFRDSRLTASRPPNFAGNPDSDGNA